MSTPTLCNWSTDETATQARRDTVWTTPYQALTHLLHLAQRAPVPVDDIVLTGEDPVLPTNFLLGTAWATMIAAGGVTAADLGYLHTGRRQRVAVDLDVELFGTYAMSPRQPSSRKLWCAGPRQQRHLAPMSRCGQRERPHRCSVMT